jgi:hypothetical protein
MKYLYLLLFLFNLSFINSQNTVGIFLNTEESFNGFTLFTPFSSTNTYLINNCGEIINKWESDFTPAASVYLLENGDLLRTSQINNPNINFGGIGGKIEKYDWDNNLIWEYDYSTDLISQHHDIYPLQNGNVLILAVTTITESEAIANGRDPTKIIAGKIYNEQIIEVQPTGSSGGVIVWEWNMSDHLIQDFDATKNNFGVVADNPQLLDFNYLGFGDGDFTWLHANSMQYNEQLDQIILSTRLLSEFYIIDHSTTTAEAASNSGGTYDNGGDFLYRWGNPQAYQRGTELDRKLFGQHTPHFIKEGLNDAGKIMIFNNGITRDPSFSEIFIITPPTSSPGFYTLNSGSNYGPENPDYIYSNPSNFYSPILSNGQRLANGNILICEGNSGHFFEIDTDGNIVWEYVNPDTLFGILTQGEIPSGNSVFRVERFALDYPAFDGRNLEPGLPIELEPDLGDCQTLNITTNEKISNIDLYPNPVKNILSFNSEDNINIIRVYSISGKELINEKPKSNSLDLSNLATGFYIIKLISDKSIYTQKVIKN